MDATNADNLKGLELPVIVTQNLLINISSFPYFITLHLLDIQFIAIERTASHS